MSQLRYWVPNALTASGIAFSALSIQCTVDGDYRMAAWWCLLTVLTDKADGAAARFLKASSSFGAQLDSFSDFFSFGVAPSTLFYGFFSHTPAAGWSDGPRHQLLIALVVVYLVCVAARLARFNITNSVHGSEGFFFGIPTTFTGGVLVGYFVMLLKYGDPAWTAANPGWDHLYAFGHVRLDAWMPSVPWLLLPGALGMISTLRMPKLGRTHRPVIDAFQFANVIGGYASGILRLLPEYLVVGGIVYLGLTVRYHLTSETARAIKLPPLFAPEEAVPAAAKAREASA